jgi:hypothetical protein
VKVVDEVEAIQGRKQTPVGRGDAVTSR